MQEISQRQDDVEPARQDAREVFALVVDRGGAELTDQRRMRAARRAPQLEVIALELNREPRTPDNVWCVIEAVACLVAGLIKEPVARRYYGRALDYYSRDLASRAG